MEEVTFLILTILVELPVALVLLQKEDWRQVCLAIVGVNMISHPIIWQLLYTYGLNWFAAEGGVAIFEGLLLGMLFQKKYQLAIFTGVFMNIVTASIGYFMF